MSIDRQLSPDQERVFLLKFGEDLADATIASQLQISEEAYRKRMGEIYKKFDIEGKGPGKQNRLLRWLQAQLNDYDPQSEQSKKPQHTDLDAIVKKLRQGSQGILRERCGTMRVLDMSYPINLEDIYTNVDVLEKVSSQRRFDLSDIVTGYSPIHRRLRLSDLGDGRISAMEALKRHEKLFVLGKPGAGKTTLLRYTVMQCMQGTMFAHLLPIFITLRQFAIAEYQPRLQEYVVQEFSNYDIGDESELLSILRNGRALIVLDGLDEVKEEEIYRVTEEIRSFSEQFYANRFIISSRIASQQYIFEKFAELEVADFDAAQILMFATKWFSHRHDYAERLIHKLEQNPPIEELATNPLLLTLLCLVFAESGEFPNNRSEIYKEGLDILLKKWDAKRNIERQQIYKKLSTQRKEGLLSHVALTTFSQGEYFFRQDRLEQAIIDYIRNLPNASSDPEMLQLDGEAIVKAIEAQHGLLVERARSIYSFSHLTFQEYLAARELVDRSDPQTRNDLATRITQPRWHDVILLVVSMLRCADDFLLLLKQQTDALIATDQKLQELLSWANQKATAIDVPSQPQAVRAFYIALARASHQTEAIGIAHALARMLVLDLDLARNLSLKLELALDLAKAFDLNTDPGLDLELDLNLALEYAAELEMDALATSLAQMMASLPQLETATSANHDSDHSDHCDHSSAITWEPWIAQLRQLMIEHCQIGYDWSLNDRQLELLRQYVEANRLIVDCLASDCYVTQSVRKQIEQGLLLATIGDRLNLY
ncbi:putative signal transduction protein with Nacht domain [Thalassoporum mexicanum PCC 7367]|uniref:NACHT domain-containing protein n=1 Tax=Thalassoporum mexicanum TaxID=3457544 RepID=UPI00029FE397|nr:NACHT domain-containing NTPase [Pseudanabaena sp. PCC 7367]AFY71833.1 putative signal transduction protein with Nacht domain [Pseudanabaena sp. PCC 7367]